MTLHGLHPAPGTPLSFCGPTAIASITGRTVAEVEQAIVAHRAEHGQPRRDQKRGAVVRTMWSNEVAPVVERLGWRVAEEQRGEFRTFAQWQRERGAGPYLVLITRHFVAVSGEQFVDTRNREPIPLAKAPYRRKRVKFIYRLEPKETLTS